MLLYADQMYVTGAVKAVSIAPNSCLIASASYDKTVGLWLTREARCLYMLTRKPFLFPSKQTYMCVFKTN